MFLKGFLDTMGGALSMSALPKMITADVDH
jgi:hypothetical protein